MSELKEQNLEQEQEQIIVPESNPTKLTAISDLMFGPDIVVLKQIEIKPKSGLDLNYANKADLSADAWDDHPFQGYVVAYGVFTRNHAISVKLMDRVMFNPTYRFYDFVHNSEKYLIIDANSIIAKFI